MSPKASTAVSLQSWFQGWSDWVFSLIDSVLGNSDGRSGNGSHSGGLVSTMWPKALTAVFVDNRFRDWFDWLFAKIDSVLEYTGGSCGSSSTGSYCGGSSSSSYSYPDKELTNLYNQQVVAQQKYSIPLQGPLGKMGFRHEAVVVTLANGETQLINKGKNFGRSSQTVVVPTKFLSPVWRAESPRESVRGYKTVGGFVKASGNGYNVFSDNCYKGTKQALEYGRKED